MIEKVNYHEPGINEYETPVTIYTKKFEDNRGYFTETFNLEDFAACVPLFQQNFVQDNESYSSKGVLRGLHFQKGDYAQAKLVRCVEGIIIDFIVDLREGLPTYGKFYYEYLTGSDNKQFYVPAGFAHGFVVLSDKAKFLYKCTNYYNKDSEGGISYLSVKDEVESVLGAYVNLNEFDLLLSDKDKEWPIVNFKNGTQTKIEKFESPFKTYE